MAGNERSFQGTDGPWLERAVGAAFVQDREALDASRPSPATAARAGSSKPGTSAATFASSRYTACRPKTGSLRTQYSTSPLLNDCAHTRPGGTPASLYSSIIFCA